MRKFLAASIDELESVFREHPGDEAVLQEISHELTHRRTDRAARLQTQVAEQLIELSLQERPDQSSNRQKPDRGLNGHLTTKAPPALPPIHQPIPGSIG